MATNRERSVQFQYICWGLYSMRAQISLKGTPNLRLMAAGGCFSRKKWLDSKPHNSPPYNTNAKKANTFTSTTLCVFMTWCEAYDYFIYLTTLITITFRPSRSAHF